jgi:ribosomal-protein-serine acetyltransferase
MFKKHNKMVELQVDNNIHLKEIEIENAQQIYNIINLERNYLVEWLPFVEETTDVSYTKSFIENVTGATSNDLIFAVRYLNKLVGLLGLKDVDLGNKKSEIGYWLSQSYQHKGIITQSCEVLIKHAFSEMGLNRIQLKVATENFKSQRVAERLGFTFEGIERDGELHSRGFVDLKVYSLLRKDNH